MTTDFDRRILARTAGIGIVGLGYVGLPLAMAFADVGFKVVGVDVSGARVGALMRGESPLIDVASGIVQRHVSEGSFSATTDHREVCAADVIFVCVPTPFDQAKSPDLSYIMAAATAIASVLRAGQLVILESTTYPGTTEEVLIPILARTGLTPGEDFYVAFSPERIDPGNRTFTIANTPKVVGGIDPESTRRAVLVLEQVVSNGLVHRVSTPRVAELTKLLENTFRAVNIALVNELAVLCDRMGIDVWEVIEAAKTKPYGFMAFAPGPGVGGHCIPVDPYYLAWKAREFDFSTKFIEVAAEINQDMPFFTVEKLRRFLGRAGRGMIGAKLLVVGAAFKPDVDDARNSAAVRVIEILRDNGATVSYHDPYVPEIQIATALYGRPRERLALRSVPLDDGTVEGHDCVVILVRHSGIDYQRLVRAAPLVFDAVNATHGISDGAAAIMRL